MKKYFYLSFILMSIVTINNKLDAQTKLSLNKPTLASGTESDNYASSYAVDADTTTKWSSAANYKQWLYVDLGAEYEIGKVTFLWADGWRPVVFDIQFSTDAVHWKTVDTFKAESNDNDSQVFDTLKGKARYVQFLGRGRGGKSGYRIADFSVYGK